MNRLYHVIALIALLLCCVVPARGDNPPVGYGNCGTDKYPILIVDGVSYGPGVSTDTITTEFGTAVSGILFVMGMDDSSAATPPCACDTMDRSGVEDQTSANNWYYKMTLWTTGPFPRDSATVYGPTTKVYEIDGVTCPDTFAVDDIDMERCGDYTITVQGRVWHGGVNGVGGDPLAPSGDNIVIPVSVTLPASSGGTWVFATKEPAS